MYYIIEVEGKSATITHKSTHFRIMKTNESIIYEEREQWYSKTKRTKQYWLPERGKLSLKLVVVQVISTQLFSRYKQ